MAWLNILGIVFVLAGCVPVVKAPPPVSPPTVKVPPPVFDRTFGEVHCAPDASLGFQYKDLKFVVSSSALRDIRSLGFGPSQGLESGTRILLKKDGTHVFSSAFRSKAPGGESEANAFLFEFDNGRNILITGERYDMTTLRNYLYSLRDDGKEIHFAFIYASDTANAASIISLFQPRTAFVLPGLPESKKRVDEAALRKALESEFFNGDLVLPEADNRFPF